MSHSIGSVVGDTYTLRELIGKGGMGYVFRASHNIIGRDYALKIMDPEQITETNWKRFQAEGQAIAKLNHPHIVSIYNMGVDRDRCPYYVMDLLHGVSLAEAIEKFGPPPVAVTIEIFLQLCSALEYAHGIGVIHRDIKPSNVILLESSDRLLKPFVDGDKPAVKVVDFGIAKLIRIGDDSIGRLTVTGEIFGTPLYMSPEQCMGSPTDRRSDIYSLGCTLYETLTGVPPLVGKNAMETVMMHLEKQPLTLAQVYPDAAYPRSLELIVAKMLEKDPGARYQSMAQIIHDLERFKSGKDVVLRKDENPGRRPSHHSADSGSVGEADTRGLSSGQIFVVVAGLIVLLVVGAVGAVGVGLIFKNSPPAPKASTEATDGFLHSTQVADEFKDVPKFSSGVQNINGRQMRVFKFSDRVPVGELFWRDGHKLALGNVFVPAELPVRLQLAVGNAEAVESNPELLARFNRDDISELSLRTAFWAAFVNQVVGWSNLKSLRLGHAPLRDSDLPCLDRLTHISELSFDNCTYNPASLAKLAILQGVKKIEFIGKKEIDEELRALSHSPRLMCLIVGRVPITTQSLENIADTKNLVELQIPAYRLTDSDMKIFSRMPNLRHLRLRRAAITPASIDTLSRLRQLKTLQMDDLDWSPADRRRLKNLLPACQFVDVKKVH